MKSWCDKSKFQKVMDIISSIALCVWLVFTIYEKAESLPYADAIVYTATTVICVCQAFSCWKDKRVISYIALGGIACMIAVVILELL